jgi:hypothetical protein
MATGDLTSRPSRTPEGEARVEYHGRRFTLEPRPHHAWAVVDERQCVGFVELTYPRIGDEGPRFAAKPVGDERAIVDGWTDDWRIAVEWLIDQQECVEPERDTDR